MAESEKSVALDVISSFESGGPGDPTDVTVQDVLITDSQAFSQSTHGEHAEATWTFTGVPADETTITLTDYASTSVTFEVDEAADGVTGGNTALDGITAAGGGATGMAADFVAKVNASALLMSAEDRGSGEVSIQQDSPGTSGNTAITYSSTSEWDSNVSEYQAPRAFSEGMHYPAPGEVIGMGVHRMGYARISYNHADLQSPSSPRQTTITIDDTENFPFPNKMNANDIAITGVWCRVATPFDASGLSHCHIEVGTDAGAGDTDAFITSTDIKNGSEPNPPYIGLSGDAVGVELDANGWGGYLHRAENNERITVKFTAQGADLDTLTAGDLDLFVQFFDLWERE